LAPLTKPILIGMIPEGGATSIKGCEAILPLPTSAKDRQPGISTYPGRRELQQPMTGLQRMKARFGSTCTNVSRPAVLHSLVGYGGKWGKAIDLYGLKEGRTRDVAYFIYQRKKGYEGKVEQKGAKGDEEPSGYSSRLESSEQQRGNSIQLK